MQDLLHPLQDDPQSHFWVTYDDFQSLFSGLALLHCGGSVPYQLQTFTSVFERAPLTDQVSSRHFYHLTAD